MHPSLRLAGLLNPLDAPHHMRADDACPFREGVVLDRTIKKGAGSFVDIGKRKVTAVLYCRWWHLSLFLLHLILGVIAVGRSRVVGTLFFFARRFGERF